MKAFFAALVAAAVAAAAWWFLNLEEPSARSGGPGFDRAVSVAVATVKVQSFAREVEGLGTARANESVTLFAKLTDTVRRVNFEDGAFVEAGTVLAELTNQEEEALLAEARANLNDANSQLKRIQDLGKRGLAAESEVDQIDAAAKAAEARLNTVLARLQDRLIRAPFSGLLGFRQVSPGTLVTPTTPITTLDDISTIKLDFTVAETLLKFLKPGVPIQARSAAWGEQEFVGEISTVASRVDPVTRAVEVRALLDNSPGLLRPGMLMSVSVVTDQREAPAVALGSVVQLGEQSFVYLVTDGQAERREVVLGQRTATSAEVLSGVGPGDAVVVRGVGRLRDGVKVTLIESPPPATPGAS
ncbi:MAG: efflux RND transporter periplasmic adaptor subunit [Pseudomonadota bacterium]